MTVEESNKLIAEFMGLIKDQDTPWYRLISDNSLERLPHNVITWSTSKSVHETQMCYHISWDWLMPVLDKIKDICFSDEGEETYDSEEFYAIRDCIPDIGSTYRAILDFIVKYNQQKA